MKRYFRSVKLLGPGEEAPTRSQYLKIVHKARAAFGNRCGLASEYLFLFLRLLEDERLQKDLSPFCQTLDRFLDIGTISLAGAKDKKNPPFTLRKPL